MNFSRGKIQIVVAEGQNLVRASLISLIKEDKMLCVIGEAENGKDLLELLKQGLKPDVVLMNIDMPVMNGYEVLDIIKTRFSNIPAVILSSHNDVELMNACMVKGARGYLSKSCNRDIFLKAIHTVKREGFYFTNDTSKALLTGLIKEKSLNPILNQMALTEREIGILKFLCDGKSNKQIGISLSIATSTVDFHRGNIYTKTNSKDITDLVKYSIKNGFINL